MRAFYPGSFDPMTNGHLDILERSLTFCKEVTLVVAGSGRKAALFSPEERVEMIREIVKDKPQVKVDLWDGLIMEYAKIHGFKAVIRGLRAASDFEYEFMMASMNKTINPGVETLFMMTSQDLYFISSSMLKELHQYGGDISPYVPQQVMRKLKGKMG